MGNVVTSGAIFQSAAGLGGTDSGGYTPATAEIIKPNGTRLPFNAASNTDAAQGTAIAAAVTAATGAANAVFNIPFVDSTGSGTFSLTIEGQVVTPVTYSATPATLIANINAAILLLFGNQIATASGTTLANLKLTFSGTPYGARPVATPTFTLLGGATGFTAGPATISTAGVRGDLIVVYRYGQVNTNLAKDGIEFYFMPGSGITNNSNSAVIIFDTTGFTVGFSVRGSGDFYRLVVSGDASVFGSIGSAGGNSSLTTGGDCGVFCNNTNTTSFEVVFEFNRAGTDFTNQTVNPTAYQSTIQSRSGSFYTKGTVYSYTQSTNSSVLGMWWILGKCICDLEFQGTAGSLIVACTDSTKGDFYLNSNEVVPGGVVSFSTDALAAAWIRVGTLRCDGNYAIGSAGGKLYITAEKIFGAISISDETASSQLFLRTAKLGGDSGGVDYITNNNTTGRTVSAWLEILKFDPTVSFNFMTIVGVNTTVNLSGQDFSPLSGNDFINCSGSTVNLISGKVTTGSSNKDLIVSSNGVINASSGTFYDVAKTTVASGGVINVIGAGNLSSSLVRSTTATTKTNTATLGNVAGLTANVVAGKFYKFTATIPYTADATGGMKIAIGGTATATTINYVGYAGGVTLTGAYQTALAGAISFTTSTAGMVTITGEILVNAAGTLTVQIAESTAVSLTSAVALAGSTFDVKQAA